MAVDDIEKKITEEGDAEIKRINKIAENNVKIIKETIKKYAEKVADKVRKDNDNRLELMRRQIIADANIKAKQMMEAEKNKLIDQVFDNAKMQILGLDNKEKTKVLEVLIKEGKKTIKDAGIIVDKKYTKLLKTKDAKSQDLNGEFGVIVQSNDGKIRIDNTLGTCLKQMEINLRPKIAEILFAAQIK